MENLGLSDFYQGKSVFVTGHTGFKGAWLCWWLKKMGAEVHAFALPPKETPRNLFSLTKLSESIHHTLGDIRDYNALLYAMQSAKPNIVFHLAAQPLVLDSYQHPIDTFAINTQGTVNVLEAIRHTISVKSAIMVTTDKCYEDQKWPWPYRENDRLGGHDPYAASKAMAKLAIQSYRQSFATDGLAIASARSGNVIGGGDFGEYRILPDIIRSIMSNKTVTLRRPHAVRPWLHVLDSLFGYLLLAKSAFMHPEKFSQAYNFSPADTQPWSVAMLTEYFIQQLGQGNFEINSSNHTDHETDYLTLDSSKAKQALSWQTHLTTQQAITMTAQWYKVFLNDPKMCKPMMLKQIQQYSEVLQTVTLAGATS